MKRKTTVWATKFITLVLALSLTLSLAGCANPANKEVDEPAVTTTEATTTEATTTEATTTTPSTTTQAPTTTTETTTTEATTTAVTTTTEATTTTVETTTEATLKVDAAGGYMYAKSSVNVRKGPGATYERVGHLNEGEKVEITGVAENGWYRIKFEGGEYFVSGNYLSTEKPVEVTTVTTTTTSKTTVTEKEPTVNASLMKDFKATITCPDDYLKKESGVKYGKTVKTNYYSKTCAKQRNVIIVLPEGYDKNKEYPVLYILHGIYGDETTMYNHGNGVILNILGNLMNDGLAEDMIVVFPYMYASKTQDVCTGIDLKNVEAYDNFVNDLVNDLMPFMKKNYAVAEGKENTAIVGFSMGGREALAIGFMKPEMFGYVGAIAPAPGLTPDRDWAMEHPGQFKESELKFKDESPYFLMVCSGDNDHTVGTFPKSYHDILKKNKVEHVWYEIPGSDHGDPAISSGIYNFALNVFK